MALGKTIGWIPNSTIDNDFQDSDVLTIGLAVGNFGVSKNILPKFL